MKSFTTLIRKDLMEQWRTKKILTLLIVFLFAAIASPIMAKLTPELMKSLNVPGLIINLPTPTFFDSIDQFVKNVSQIALLVLVFVVAGAVSDEKNRKTLEIVLTKPISRVRFILSKFSAYFISVSAIFIASATIFYLYTSSVFEWFNFANFVIVAACILAYLLMISAITILASTIVNNSIAAGGIGFIFYILFGTVMDLIAPLKDFSPNIFLTNYKDIIKNGWNGDLLLPVITMFIAIITSMLIAIYSFRKQEIER